MEMVEELIYEKLDYFKTRPLKSDWFSVFIDAYHCELREEGKMVKISIFVAVGIDMDGYKHILGYWVHKGNENLGLWSEVFQDLINRGLSKVFVFVTDNFSGLDKLLKKFFPLSDHQLCYVHFARNLRNKLSPKVSKEAIALWKKIKMAYDYDEGCKLYDQLLTLVEKNKPDYAKYLQKYKENYLNFLKYPEDIRKYVYTTNIVESINAGLERMRYDVGGYFGSMKTIEINLFVQLINLHDSWLTKPIPVLKSKAYDLK
ncbi:IS256 family transposase [Deferribacter autotrophicus]|nr:transposase [Deferribacter autotrophicus]